MAAKKLTEAERKKRLKVIQKGVKAERKRTGRADQGNPDSRFHKTETAKQADAQTAKDNAAERKKNPFGFIESKTKGEGPKKTPTKKEKEDLKKRPKTAAAASANQLRDKIDQEKRTKAIRRRRRGQK